MSVEERITSCIAAALADPRVNVLCLRKDEDRSLKSVIEAIAQTDKSIRFDYYSTIGAQDKKSFEVRRLAKQIYEYRDAREIRSILDGIFDSSKQAGLIRRNLSRSGFVNYLRSLPEAQLIEVINSGYYNWLPAIGSGVAIGSGRTRILVYDNVGKLIEREGIRPYLRRQNPGSRPQPADRMIIIAGDYEFPSEIVELGSWGYTVDVRSADLGFEVQEFSPVELEWDDDILLAEDRAEDAGFRPDITPNTLRATLEALGVMSTTLAQRVPNEQVDQRLATLFSDYSKTVAESSPNTILLDCYFDTLDSIIRAEEGTSTIFSSMFIAFRKRHRALINASEVCRDLDRVARLTAPEGTVPEQLLRELISEIAGAERDQIVDKSVQEAAVEIAELEKSGAEDGKKKKVVLTGFVKAMWIAMQRAPDVVKGEKAFQDLLAMAGHIRDYIINNWHTWV